MEPWGEEDLDAWWRAGAFPRTENPMSGMEVGDCQLRGYTTGADWMGLMVPSRGRVINSQLGRAGIGEILPSGGQKATLSLGTNRP